MSLSSTAPRTVNTELARWTGRGEEREGSRCWNTPVLVRALMTGARINKSLTYSEISLTARPEGGCKDAEELEELAL